MVIVLSLLVAYYITQPNSLSWIWEASTKVSTAVSKKVVYIWMKLVDRWQRFTAFPMALGRNRRPLNRHTRV